MSNTNVIILRLTVKIFFDIIKKEKGLWVIKKNLWRKWRYYIIKKAYLKNITAVGVALYAILFLFFIQKYIRLPQFTLTSAFMATGAIVLFHEMPAHHNAKQIILAALCCLGSFSVRSKTFYILLPIIILIIVVRLIREKGTKLWKPFTATCLSAIILCTGVAIADYASWNRNEDYQYFDRFNVARSQVYDYGGAPNYYDNMPFYLENDINEVTYRAMSARYLDIDNSVDAETLEKVENVFRSL